MRSCWIAVVLVSVSQGVAAGGERRGLEPGDFYQEATIESAAVSPAGDLVAFTVMTVKAKANKRHREIWMQRLENGQPQGKPFRFTNPAASATSPVWSPDGDVLSFQSKRGDDENSTWFIRVTAPGGEADHVEGVDAAPVWSPDGKWIAFVKRPKDTDTKKQDKDSGDEKARDAKEEKKGDDSEPNDDKTKSADKTEPPKERKGWIAPDAISNTLDAKRFDGRVVTSMRYKRDGTRSLIPHYKTREKSQLFVVPAAGGEARQLTELPYSVGQIEWTADGRTILFSADESEDDEYETELMRNLYAVSRDGGEPRALTKNPGSESSPAVSPDGARLAYLFAAKRGAPQDLMVVEVDAAGQFRGSPRNLTADWELTPGTPEWTAGSNAVRFSTFIGGNRHLFEVTLGDGRIRQVTAGDRVLRSVSSSRDGAVTAYAVTTPRSPAELFVADANGREQRITTLNDDWLAKIELAEPERLTWTVADGTGIEGWLIKPVGYQPGQKYPLVLKIHGGPHSVYGNYWFRTFHVLSSAGFFVLYTNPRGSSGYGHEFTYATRGRWGEMDSEDYLTGVDAAMAKYPDIDPQRLGVSGGSYGGFMTNWLTATTNRFAAAVTSRSIVNWESWYGSSDAQRLTEFEFGGTPWERRETYRRLSPLSYVENVTAPTLIIHSENDYRTPIVDGETWFMALKKRQVPTELVRYPRSSHGLSRTGEPWLLVDRLERLRSWFAHWLIEQPQKLSGRPDKPIDVNAASARFQKRLDALRSRHGFPGATAAFALADGRIVTVATGLADREEQIAMKPDSRMLSGSIGKTFVAALALQLVAEGKLSLDRPIKTWLGAEPWFDRLPGGNQITLRHLLTHSSGLPDHVYSPEYAHAVKSERNAEPDRIFPPRRLVNFVLDKELLFPVGEGYQYTDTGYILVGLIIEKAGGRPYYEQLQSRILGPLELTLTSPSNKRELTSLAPGHLAEDNRFGLPQKNAELGLMRFNPGTEWTGGGLCSNPRDLVRWAMALYRGGLFETRWQRELLASKVPRDDSGERFYGLGVYVSQTPLGTSLGHGGWFPGWRSSMQYFPNHELAVAVQLNTDVDVDPTAYAIELARTIVAQSF